METVTALKESCLLQLKLKDLAFLTSPDLKYGAGGSFVKDYQTLMQFLESNYTIKNDWRISHGIINGTLSTEQQQTFLVPRDQRNKRKFYPMS